MPATGAAKLERAWVMAPLVSIAAALKGDTKIAGWVQC